MHTSGRWGSSRRSQTHVSSYVSTIGKIGVYVDDMVMAGKDEASLQKVKDELHGN